MERTEMDVTKGQHTGLVIHVDTLAFFLSGDGKIWRLPRRGHKPDNNIHPQTLF